MDTPKRKLDIGGYIFGICFVLVFLTAGILFIVNGAGRKAYIDNFKETAVAVRGVCVSRVHGNNFYANFKYEYNDSEYTATGVKVAKKTKKGWTVTLYVNPDYPVMAISEDEENEVQRQIIAGFLLAGIGVIALGIGVFAFIYNRVSPNGIYYTPED